VVPWLVQTDEAANDNTEETGDRTEPHVAHVVQPEVVEAGLGAGEGGGGDGVVGDGRLWQPGGRAVVSRARHEGAEPRPVVGPVEVGSNEAKAPPEDKDER